MAPLSFTRIIYMQMYIRKLADSQLLHVIVISSLTKLETNVKMFFCVIIMESYFTFVSLLLFHLFNFYFSLRNDKKKMKVLVLHEF